MVGPLESRTFIPRSAFPFALICKPQTANSLGGQNSARTLRTRASFQRDNLRRNFRVRVLYAQPRSRSLASAQPGNRHGHSGARLGSLRSDGRSSNAFILRPDEEVADEDEEVSEEEEPAEDEEVSDEEEADERRMVARGRGQRGNGEEDEEEDADEDEVTERRVRRVTKRPISQKARAASPCRY
jgi:hypothetical protein